MQTKHTPWNTLQASLDPYVELLEALKALLRNAEDKAKYISMLEGDEKCDDAGNVIVNDSPEMEQARAVLAKAKGTK